MQGGHNNASVRPYGAHNTNGISIGSFIFVYHAAQYPYTL